MTTIAALEPAIQPEPEFGIVAIGDRAFLRRNVPGDGNCFWNCVVQLQTGRWADARALRTALVREMLSTWQTWRNVVDVDDRTPPPMGRLTDALVYAAYMTRDGVWADEPEIAAVATCFGLRISVWDADGARWCEYAAEPRTAQGEADEPPRLYLLRSGGNHYQMLSELTTTTI